MRKRHVPSGKRPINVKEAVEQIAPKERTIALNANRVTTVVKIRKKSVAWGIPLDEVMFSKFFQNFFGLGVMPWDSILLASSTYLPDARNIIHTNFLATDIEWLAMLDSDVLPPPSFLDQLLAHKLPMVGGWYRKKGEGYPPVVYDFDHIEDGINKFKIRNQPGVGLEKVDAAGAGCWLMHRDVALAIGERPYNMEHGGEDLELCRKVQAAGFDIYIDWDVACAHAGTGIY